MRKTLYITALLFALPLFAHAATVSLVQTPATVGVGDTVTVTMLIDTTVQINTFSGAVAYSADLLGAPTVSDGNSIVSLWLTHPHDTGGTVAFAGLVPGGYAGRGGVLFKLRFVAKAVGEAQLSLMQPEMLRNDGSGTQEPISARTLTIVVQKASAVPVATPEPPEVSKIKTDTEPPEPIAAAEWRGVDLFGGGAYVVFTTVDKKSGIDHYEVAETRWFGQPTPVAWERTESPHLLHDQYETSDIYIKAVDGAGNERVAELTRRYPLRSYEVLALLGVVVLLAAGYAAKKIYA